MSKKKSNRRVREEEQKKDKERKKGIICASISLSFGNVDVAKFKEFLKKNKSENPRLVVLYKRKTPDSSLESAPLTNANGKVYTYRERSQKTITTPLPI